MTLENSIKLLGEQDFRLYRSMKRWSYEVGDMLAYVSDVLQPHGFEQIVENDFVRHYGNAPKQALPLRRRLSLLTTGHALRLFDGLLWGKKRGNTDHSTTAKLCLVGADRSIEGVPPVSVVSL